ncbi:MAG: PEP-CTERM sorting domain-containing protein [Caldimonas sp.]
MKSIHRTIQRLALAALAATAFLSQAEAAGPVVTVTPATQTIGVTGMANVDIIVSGLSLTDPTGGFSLTLGFNNSFLSGASFMNDPGGTMGLAPLDLSLGFSGGSLDLFFVASESATLASLAAAEGTSFTLATLHFMGTAAGLSPLTLSNVVLSNWNGDSTLAGVTAINGDICVSVTGAPCAINPVPEPETMVLLATGLAALALRRRRRA